MALHIRRSDAADYVHTSDPSVVVGNATQLVAREWLPAASQPREATRVRVRPLDVFEFGQFAGATNAAERMSAAWVGLIGIDGAAVSLDDVDAGLAYAIAELVPTIFTGLSSGAAPLDRSE